MTASDDPVRRTKPDTDYSDLPSQVRAEDTVASVDTNRLPDSDDVRNVDQHRALRDD